MMKPPIAAVFIAAFLFVTQSANTASAEQIWQIELDGKTEWQMVAADGSLLIATQAGLANYSTENGTLRWNRNMAVPSRGEIIALPGNTHMLMEIRANTKKRRGRKKNATPRVFEAINLETGEPDWKIDNLQGSLIGFHPVAGHDLLLVFELVKVKDKDASGIFMTAYNSRTGTQMWRTRYADRKARLGASKATGFSVLAPYAPAVIDRDTLYIPFRGLHAFDLNSGSLKWGSAFATADMSVRYSYATPVVDGDIVYAAGAGTLQAFNKTSGERLWQTKLKRSPIVKEIVPASRENIVLVRTGGTFTTGGKLANKGPLSVRAVDIATGKVRWRYEDAKGSLSNLVIDNTRGHVVFADSEAVIAVSLNLGAPQYEAPLVYWRLYGLFNEKKSGFSIGGGFSKSSSSGSSSGGGGLLGMGGSKLDLGANPIAAEIWKNEIIIRGPHYIVAFDPDVALAQWAALFSDTGRIDSALLRTGDMHAFSDRGRAYFLTQLTTGKGKRAREVMTLLGIQKASGKVVSRLDLGGTNASFLMDHKRDRLYYIIKDRKKTTINGHKL